MFHYKDLMKQGAIIYGAMENVRKERDGEVLRQKRQTISYWVKRLFEKRS